MAYSISRLRKTLAVVRIVTGGIFIAIGSFKISSLEFAKNLFPAFLEDGIQGSASDWVRPLLEWIVSFGPGRIGVLIGFVELFVGIALLLGLAVRPAALVGMAYSTFLILSTWKQPPAAPAMLQSAEHQFGNAFLFLVFLLLGVGHAGETWGIGSLYHRRRARRHEREEAADEQVGEVSAQEEREAGSFEEFLEREERALRGDTLGSEPEVHETSEQ